MKTGWLVINQFLHTPKFEEIYQWLELAASRQEMNLIRYTNAQLMCQFDNRGKLSGLPAQRPDFVLFMDKDIRLGRALEREGFRLFNCAEAVQICDDKSLTIMALMNSGIRMPKTVLAPMTYSNIGYTDTEFLDQVEVLGYPLIAKECFGSFGQQVYLVKNREALEQLVSEKKGITLLFQEYVKSSCGRDIRINMVGGEPVAAMYRYNDDDFRANITNGGKMESYTPTAEQIDMARKVCQIISLDFAGVDILFGPEEEPVFCEVNSNAHFKNIYDCTGINVADAMMEHIKKQICHVQK